MAALLLVPTALADPTYPDAFERAVNARLAGAPDAVDRAVAVHSASLASAVSPGRVSPDRAPTGSAFFPSSTADGFDWASAAIGGSAMLALVLLVGGGTLATRYSRGRVALR
jgi:hypothetical protein